MKKILIISLRRDEDIFSISPLVGNLQQKYHGAKVSILTTSEGEQAAKCIKGISEIYTIPIEEISSIKKSQIFSDGHAINKFHSSLKQVKEESWDIVVNPSDDKLGACLTSHLSPKEFIGCMTSTQGRVKTSNRWAQLLSNLSLKNENAFLNHKDIFNLITNIPAEIKTREDILKVNQDYFMKAHQNLQPFKNAGFKVVGLQLKSSASYNNIPFSVYHELIAKMIDGGEFYPVLIISTSQDEKNIVNQLNQQFDNKLITVSTDYCSLTALTYHLDALISPSSPTKEIANLTDTPIIEISFNAMSFRGQATTTQDNLILAPNTATYENSHYQNSLRGNDIYIALENIFNRQDISEQLSDDFALYRVHKDNLGSFYVPFAGKINPNDEMLALTSRIAIHKLVDNTTCTEALQFMRKYFSKDELCTWVEREKENITLVLKDLFSTIKAVKALSKSTIKANIFAAKLDNLLLHGQGEHLSSITCLQFQGQLESMDSTSAEENMTIIERKLFEMKNNLQSIVSIMDDMLTVKNEKTIVQDDQLPAAI